jgi:hypothetical protein
MQLRRGALKKFVHAKSPSAISSPGRQYCPLSRCRIGTRTLRASGSGNGFSTVSGTQSRTR